MQGYEISTDRARVDVGLVHRFLSESAYWALAVPYDVVARSIEASLCFGLYAPAGVQAGFARVITDTVSHAYLADVFVLPEHRGRGLGVWLVQTALAHPDVEQVDRVLLGTRDAHSLYARFGFGPFEHPERWLERRR